MCFFLYFKNIFFLVEYVFFSNVVNKRKIEDFLLFGIFVIVGWNKFEMSMY